MKKLAVAFVVCLIWASWAWGHGDLSKFPADVQIMQYRQAVWLNPENVEARNNLALAYYLKNELDESEKEFRHVLKKDPKNFDALDGLGIVFIRKNKYKDALEYLEKALKINEHDLMIHVHLSVVHHKMKSRDKAKSEWKKAKSLAANRVQRRQIEKELKLVSGR